MVDMKKGDHVIIVTSDYLGRSGYKVLVKPMARYNVERDIISPGESFVGAAEGVDPSEADRVREYVNSRKHPYPLSARELAMKVGTPWRFA